VLGALLGSLLPIIKRIVSSYLFKHKNSSATVTIRNADGSETRLEVNGYDEDSIRKLLEGLKGSGISPKDTSSGGPSS
jgi:hypothetical protein